MDFSDKITAFGLGTSGLLFTVFYKLYCSRYRAAERIAEAKSVQLKDVHEVLQQADDHRIPYATLEGLVQPYHQKLQSHHGTMEGVVHLVQKVEHKSQRIQGYWSNAKRVLQDTLDVVPFKLVDPKTKTEVNVMEAETAALLQDELTVIFDHFDPGHTSLLKSGIERIFGDVTKGIQDTEKMLLIGTNLRGIGEICLEEGKAVIGPPSDGSKYVLTKLSKGAVIRKFESQAFVFKVLTFIFGAVSTGLIVFLLFKAYRRYRDYRRLQSMYADIRSARGRRFSDSENTSQQCVVCMNNQTDVIVMDCRHVCLCSHCAELLPHPQKCPICRDPVRQFLPLYRS